LRNGERPERRKALASIEEARRAQFKQAKSDWERSEKLAGTRATSKEQWDRDYFAMLRSQAQLDEAVAERALVEAPPRPEDVAAAEGNVAAAEARLGLAKAELARTQLLAPSAGRVLKIFAEPGELASPTTAEPVLLLADLSKRRVRAFVEELDAARVKAGQRAIVTADGFPGKSFNGQVALVVPRMGRGTLQTDEPGEHKDVYFREVVIDLESAEELPINLRVQVKIQVQL
jgi:multidrug resistance efflux pump